MRPNCLHVITDRVISAPALEVNVDLGPALSFKEDSVDLKMTWIFPAKFADHRLDVEVIIPDEARKTTLTNRCWDALDDNFLEAAVHMQRGPLCVTLNDNEEALDAIIAGKLFKRVNDSGHLMLRRAESSEKVHPETKSTTVAAITSATVDHTINDHTITLTPWECFELLTHKHVTDQEAYLRRVFEERSEAIDEEDSDTDFVTTDDGEDSEDSSYEERASEDESDFMEDKLEGAVDCLPWRALANGYCLRF